MSTIVSQELEVRAVVYDVLDADTLLVKIASAGRVYGELKVGTNLTLRTTEGKTYLDSAGAATAEILVTDSEPAAPAAGKCIPWFDKTDDLVDNQYQSLKLKFAVGEEPAIPICVPVSFL